MVAFAVYVIECGPEHGGRRGDTKLLDYLHWPKVCNAKRYLDKCRMPERSWYKFQLVKTKLKSGKHFYFICVLWLCMAKLLAWCLLVILAAVLTSGGDRC